MVTNNLPRRKIIRLKGYNYSQPGAYFITVCTKDRMHLYGEVDGEEMLVNRIGQIVEGCWNELPDHYPNVQLDEFAVMPNHVHGIIILLDHTVGATSRRPEIGAGRLRPYLGNVVAYFKYQSTKRINEFHNTPGATVWQRGYFDHIIRDERSLTRIREYIASNPQRWSLDAENRDRTGDDESDTWLTSRPGRANIE